MAVQKTPAFPFYFKDAYEDEAFCRLSWAGQGLWMFLACWQWSEGSVPAHLDDILDRVPRPKVRESRTAWKHVEAMFPRCESDPSRRANKTVEHHRQKICGLSDRHRKGAEITNQKRWGGSLSESLSDADSESLRAASANAIGSLSQSTKNPEGVQGEGERPFAETLAVAARLVPLLDASALRDKPPEGIVLAWVRDRGYDEALIRETLVDCEDQYGGKGWRYFERILATRHEDPSQRPSRRARKPQKENGNGSGKPKPDFGHSDGFELLAELEERDRLRALPIHERQLDVDDFRDLQRWVEGSEWLRAAELPPEIGKDIAARFLSYVKTDLGGSISEAPTLRHFAEVSK